jgi:hypothetical protein
MCLECIVKVRLMRDGLCTEVPESWCTGSSPLRATHRRTFMSGASRTSSPRICSALTAAMPGTPVNRLKRHVPIQSIPADAEFTSKRSLRVAIGNPPSQLGRPRGCR